MQNIWLRFNLFGILAWGALLPSAWPAPLSEIYAEQLFQQAKDKKEVQTELSTLAAAGDPLAQDRLGLAYLVGQGVAKDTLEARKWLLRSAEQGYAYAQFRLGFIYEDGLGVDKDTELAIDWYQKAAMQGNTAAAYNLGLIYQNGTNSKQSDALAAKWYRIAAEGGLPYAQLNLGLLYMKESAEIERDYAVALEWLQKSAANGNARAKYNLGTLYAEGNGTPRDETKALSLYREAADEGEWWAMYAIAIAYKTGSLGLSVNNEKYEEWYRRFIDAQIASQRKPTP